MLPTVDLSAPPSPSPSRSSAIAESRWRPQPITDAQRNTFRPRILDSRNEPVFGTSNHVQFRRVPSTTIPTQKTDHVATMMVVGTLRGLDPMLAQGDTGCFKHPCGTGRAYLSDRLADVTPPQRRGLSHPTDEPQGHVRCGPATPQTDRRTARYPGGADLPNSIRATVPFTISVARETVLLASALPGLPHP